MSRPDRLKGSRARYEWLVTQVAQQPTDTTAPCQIWPHAVQKRDKNGAGHGVVVMPDGSRELVHRVAYMLVHGFWPIPCCIHDCDNPPCFLVAHLRQATQLENIADMQQKNRQSGGKMPGESHPNVILTDDQVREIRKEYVKQYGELTRLGKVYGVTPSTIFDIVNRRSWTHI